MAYVVGNQCGKELRFNVSIEEYIRVESVGSELYIEVHFSKNELEVLMSKMREAERGKRYDDIPDDIEELECASEFYDTIGL